MRVVNIEHGTLQHSLIQILSDFSKKFSFLNAFMQESNTHTHTHGAQLEESLAHFAREMATLLTVQALLII